MTRAGRSFPLLVFLSAARSFPSIGHFYNVDTEIRSKGSWDISLEPAKDRSPFLVVTREGRLSRISTVKSAPRGSSAGRPQGENLEVTGSVVSTADRSKILIARQIRFRGETSTSAAARFPSWRGGPDRKGAAAGPQVEADFLFSLPFVGPS